MSTAVSPTPETRVRPLPPPPPPGVGYDRQAVVARQKEEFGGMKFGATFFGWLTASGAAVLLAALAAAVAAVAGRSGDLAPTSAPGGAATIGVAAAVVGLTVVLLAYFCGGYVAGRMARFHGVRQGIGVWLWAVVAAVVLAVLGLIAGEQLGSLGGALPTIPTTPETITTAGITAAAAVAGTSLVGAILGGLTGMRFHRRVDRVGEDI